MVTDNETLHTVSPITIEREKAHASYRHLLSMARDEGPETVREVMRELNRRDLFYLLVYTLNRQDADRDFVFARCREVQADPYGHLDLWARYHYKSTIISFTKTIQDFIIYPDWPVVIMSFNRPTAKKFLRQIKFELENNQKLKDLHPEVFWQDPKHEAPKWSEDDGLFLRRKGNPKDASLEAYGMVDSQPTSAHYEKRIYNDIVNRAAVSTPDMIKKVTDAWEQSLALGTETGVVQYEGTRWHFADTYKTIIGRRAAKPRIYPATEDGTLTGKPVLWTPEHLHEQIRLMGPYTAACQLFLNPIVENKEGFLQEWLKYWPATHYKNMNLYILCDPANEKKKSNDYTVFMVVGLGQDRNYYVITMIRDRINLRERTNILFTFHQTYSPKNTGYEKFGKDSDKEHFEDRMSRDNYRFNVEALHENVPKNDRIKRLIPLFAEGRIYLPESCVRTNYEGVSEDLTKVFVQTEYSDFPFSEHDDMLDCLAKILDPNLQATFPMGPPEKTHGLEKKYEDELKNYDPLGRNT